MSKSGSEIALDTNMAIDVLNGKEGTGEWIQGFQQISLPVPVIGELSFGALRSRRPESNAQRIQSLLERCKVLDIRLPTTAVYARLRLALKERGKPIPENDLWIAAICVEHDLPLATRDAHFREVSGLAVRAPSE